MPVMAKQDNNSLFSARPKDLSRFSPLADRMRPQSLRGYVGQSHIVGEDRLLRKLIKTDKLTSLIFWGPPGVGKTTLARIIARVTKAHFAAYSAVASSGYGLLFMEYPDNCLSGYCLLNSRISLLLPIGDYQAGTMHWVRYTLNGAEGSTGHTYTETDSYPAPLTTIEIRQVLADLDNVSGLSEPD